MQPNDYGTATLEPPLPNPNQITRSENPFWLPFFMLLCIVGFAFLCGVVWKCIEWLLGWEEDTNV